MNISLIHVFVLAETLRSAIVLADLVVQELRVSQPVCKACVIPAVEIASAEMRLTPVEVVGLMVRGSDQKHSDGCGLIIDYWRLRC